jgi:pilus assembly protein CpaB
MKRRVIAGLVAMLLAAVAGVLLLSYVGAADRRAMAEMAPTRVLVVTERLPAGATAAQIAAAVEVRELPGTAVAPGAASALSDVKGLVSTTTLEPGEQLLSSRLADPAVLRAEEGVQVPKGYQQVSVQLELERALGGTVAAGTTVGVFLSVEDDKVSETAQSLHKVLVTAVQGGPAAPSGNAAKPAAGSTTAETVMVTLALKPAAAQQLVFAAEHGSVWLSAEPLDAPTPTLPVLTKGNLYR